MTCKIKRRSLRCGGRPKADFGSIFTTFIAPTLGVAGSVADSAISKTQVSKSNTKPAVKETNTEVTNNTSVKNLPTIQVPTKDPISGLVTSNTVIPPDPTKTPTMRLGGRKKCWIGAAIGAATSIAGSLFGAAAQKREMRRQKSIQDWQNTTQEAANMTTALNNSQDYQEDYLRQFRTAARLGKTLGAKGIYITDGGDATKIGNNTYLLRGGSHEDVNETGQTGIGINVGGNEVEAEGGEVAQKKNGALRIFSAQPILGNGMSPAQAILRGYNKDSVFKQQQAFKKRNGLKDDGSKAQIGGYYGANYPSPLSLLSVIYDKTLGRFDNKNPFLQTGTAPTPSRGLNLKQVRNGLVNKNMLRTNRVYRITNMREVKDAKAIGQYRKLPEGVRLPKKTVVSKNGRTFSIGKVGGNSHGGKAAAMGEPWTGTTSGGYNESKYVISTPSRHTVWQVGHHGNYSKPLPADAIKKGSGLWKKFDAEGNTGISTKRMVVYKDLGNGRYLRLAKSKYRLGGLTSKRRNHLSDDGNKARYGTEVPYKRIHINEDGTFTDTLTGKNYNTSATNGEDVVIIGKANHWKEAGKKDTSSYFDPMGAVNFITAAGAPILNANPSNIIGSIRDSKNASDFLKHYMMQDTGGFVNTKWAKEHPYLSLGINTIGDIGLGIGTNKTVDILRHPMNYGKYGYKLNKLYKKAGLLDRGEYKTIQENYEKLLDYYTGNKPYDAGAADYTYDIKARNNAENVNPDIFYSYVTPQKGERAKFSRAYNKKATDNVFTEMHTPIRYGFDFGKSNDVKTYDDLMNHNPEYYEFLKETRLPWDEQSTVDEFLKRQQTSLRGVYADDKETAKNYLTTILGVRKGGDRLDTHGGLYTSNSTGIADAFKNPDDGISNGYIGKLLYDFDIDKTKPIADQLRQARMKIVRGGHNNIFAGSKYYNESINDARRKGAVAVEDNYGRSNGDVLNVTERAYFPGSAKQNKLTLQNLEEYLAQENQRGRWNTNGVDKMKGDEELFIPREYNRFDDFIREARIFMKPRREYNSDKERKFMEELADRMWARSKYRNSLIDMSRRLRRRNERNGNHFDVNKNISLMDIYEPLMDSYGPFRFGGRCKLRNGGLTSKDKGSSKHPYPSVSSKDFAGGGRSYPIPTKADAVDALRLAGLHGKSDVKSKVYSKYPSLRKKSLLGSCNRPVKGMRPKADTGIFVPYNKRYTSIYDAPDYDSDYNGGNVLGNGEVTVTAKRIKPTFMKPNNDAMNIINHPANETPYVPQRHNRSRTIFSGGDYLGLGIDTLAALSTGLVNYNTAGKYVLPDRAPIIQASKLPTTYNVNPEIEEVKRYRDRLTGQTFNNTSSSVAALNRSSAINLDALSNLSKLWATKENEENKMLTEDAKNQQIVAAQNVQNELARQSEIARIKNEAIQAKGDAINVGLSGLSQAWTNFWTAGRTAYEDDQSRRAMIASSKEATPTRLSEMDFDLSPDILASLYRTAKDDRTKRFYLSRLSPKQRLKYGIN